MIIPESYLAHGLFGRGEERANHKYVARIPTGKNSYRYFYSAAEYKAYKMGKSVGNRIDKMKDQTSKTIQAYNNKVRSSAKSTSNKVGKFIDRTERDISKTAKSAYNKANNFVDDVVDDVKKSSKSAYNKANNFVDDVVDDVKKSSAGRKVSDVLGEARKTIDKIGNTDLLTYNTWVNFDSSKPNIQQLMSKHTTKLNGKKTYTRAEDMDAKDVAEAHADKSQRIAKERQKAYDKFKPYIADGNPVEMAKKMKEDPDGMAKSLVEFYKTLYESTQNDRQLNMAFQALCGGEDEFDRISEAFDNAQTFLTEQEVNILQAYVDYYHEKYVDD